MKKFWQVMAGVVMSFAMCTNCYAGNFFTDLFTSKPKVGETIIFGNYYLVNEKKLEPLEWQVLDVQDGKALLITKYCIIGRPYHKEFKDITWAESEIRSWLNSDFFFTAFNAEERGRIADTFVINTENTKYGTPGGVNTTDKIFLLSIAEVQQYFKNDEVRRAKATPFAKMRGAWVSDDGLCWWWLRSPGHFQGLAACVDNGGGVYSGGSNVGGDGIAARAALWLNL